MAAAAAVPSIPKELIDQFVTGPMSAPWAPSSRTIWCYRPGVTKPEDASNHRKGASSKTVLTEDGPLLIDLPRAREGSFKPLLIPKHVRCFTGFADKIVAMYARGRDGARDPGLAGRAVPHRDGAGLHQHCHRRRHGRGLGPAYTAVSAEAAEQALNDFEHGAL